MSEALLLVAAVFTCYRLSRLMAIDDGPGDLILKLRIKCGAYDYRPNDGQAETSLGRGITCPHCWGVWFGLALALILFGPHLLTLLWWGLIAGGQSFLQEVNHGSN